MYGPTDSYVRSSFSDETLKDMNESHLYQIEKINPAKRQSHSARNAQENISLYIEITLYILNILQYIPRNMHTAFALLCFVVVIHWLIFPYPSGLLHWHCGNLTIAPVPAKQPWWIWITTPCEFIMNDCVTTTKQSTTKPCAYFLRYTVYGQCMIVPHKWTKIWWLATAN